MYVLLDLQVAKKLSLGRSGGSLFAQTMYTRIRSNSPSEFLLLGIVLRPYALPSKCFLYQ